MGTTCLYMVEERRLSQIMVVIHRFDSEQIEQSLVRIMFIVTVTWVIVEEVAVYKELAATVSRGIKLIPNAFGIINDQLRVTERASGRFG